MLQWISISLSKKSRLVTMPTWQDPAPRFLCDLISCHFSTSSCSLLLLPDSSWNIASFCFSLFYVGGFCLFLFYLWVCVLAFSNAVFPCGWLFRGLCSLLQYDFLIGAGTTSVVLYIVFPTTMLFGECWVASKSVEWMNAWKKMLSPE